MVRRGWWLVVGALVAASGCTGSDGGNSADSTINEPSVAATSHDGRDEVPFELLIDARVAPSPLVGPPGAEPLGPAGADAADEDGLAQTWDSWGLPEPYPDVDFGDERVVFMGFTESLCSYELDAVTIDRPTAKRQTSYVGVEATLPELSDSEGCADYRQPRTLVVSIPVGEFPEDGYGFHFSGQRVGGVPIE